MNFPLWVNILLSPFRAITVLLYGCSLMWIFIFIDEDFSMSIFDWIIYAGRREYE